MSVAYIQTDTRLARFHSIFSIQPVTIAPCAQKVEFLWSDFRLHTIDCLLDENQSFRKRRGKHWTIPGHRCLTPEIRFWFTYSFRFSTVGFAPTKKRGQTQTTLTNIHNTTLWTKTHEINISFYLHAQTIFIFFSFHLQYAIYLHQTKYNAIQAHALIYWNAKIWRVFSLVKKSKPFYILGQKWAGIFVCIYIFSL